MARSFSPSSVEFACVLLFLGGMALSACQTIDEAQDAYEASVEQHGDLPETNTYAIDTDYGRMVVELFDETPHHRDNFKHLVEQDFYDGTYFHRIIEGFVIQGGDPESRDNGDNLGQGGPGYTVPAEIRDDLYHRRGALGAARLGDDENPERRSSGSQFYIVQGREFDEEALDEMEETLRDRLDAPEFVLTEDVRQIYREEGGTPQLDRQYTVFGQLREGFDVMDEIAAVATPRTTQEEPPEELPDRPLEDIRITVTPLDDSQP